MLRTIFRQAFKPTESALFGVVPVRTNKVMRTPPTDTSKFIPLLDETQLFVPVVHRRHAVPLRKLNGPGRRLRSRHYVYDTVVPPKQPMPDVEVILVKDVPGKGVKGTKLKVAGDKAYAEFLIPQYAVYSNPENDLKYESLIEDVQKNTQFSTLSAQRTTLILSQCMVFFYMNMKNPWTVSIIPWLSLSTFHPCLCHYASNSTQAFNCDHNFFLYRGIFQIEKWHARVAFRQAGIILSEDCIELPKQPISGPDPMKQGKHFITSVVINGKERVPVLCRINHFINNEDEKLYVAPYFSTPIEPVFEEDRAQIQELVHHRDEVKRFKF